MSNRYSINELNINDRFTLDANATAVVWELLRKCTYVHETRHDNVNCNHLAIVIETNEKSQKRFPVGAVCKVGFYGPWKLVGQREFVIGI